MRDRKFSDDERRDFDRVCVVHRKYLVRFLRDCGATSDEAEDVAQETFLKASRHWLHFDDGGDADPRARARTWLATIAKRLFIQFRRNDGRRAALLCEHVAGLGSENPEERPDYRPHTHTVIYPRACSLPIADERPSSTIESALMSLDPVAREILVRYEFGDQSYERISAELGIAKGTVNSRLFRARQKLAPILADYARAEHGMLACDQPRQDAQGAAPSAPAAYKQHGPAGVSTSRIAG